MGPQASSKLTQIFPILGRLRRYTLADWWGDSIAGLVAAVMLVPQAMAYAALAGLPPQVGLYACIVPLIVYGLLGTSGQLSVGPVALIALLALADVSRLAEPKTPEYISLCVTLAALCGVVQILMCLLRMGFLVNFISHPVMVGFTSAVAVLIGLSQLKYLFGFSVTFGPNQLEWMRDTIVELPNSNWPTVVLGLSACGLLIAWSWGMPRLLRAIKVNEQTTKLTCQLGPLFVVLIATVLVGMFNWAQAHRIDVVGTVPAGLPHLAIPDLSIDRWIALGPTALVVALVGYVQSISMAHTLASRRREKVLPNRELFSLGAANLAASVSSGFPVTGSLSVSSLKEMSGARTGISSIVTAVMVAIALVFFTSWMYWIPKCVLAAVVIVSVAGLFQLKIVRQLWQYSRRDAFSLIITFIAVLLLGVQTGILVGMGANIGLWMWFTSRPRIVEVGRIPGTQIFRNVQRYENVEMQVDVLVIRIDESLYFANARYLNDYVTARVAERPNLKAIIIIASGINQIDATGMETLRVMADEFSQAGIRLVLSDVKGYVLNRMEQAGFDPEFLKTQIFLSADLALRHINESNTEVAESGPSQVVPQTLNVQPSP